MVQKLTLRGLGLPYMQAELLADYPVTASVVAAGASQGSATIIGGNQYVVNLMSGTSGVALPNIGGDLNAGNCDLGDDFTLTNFTAASVCVYANGSDTFIGAGVSTAGTTGVSIPTLKVGVFVALSTTTWNALIG